MNGVYIICLAFYRGKIRFPSLSSVDFCIAHPRPNMRFSGAYYTLDELECGLTRILGPINRVTIFKNIVLEVTVRSG